LQGCPKLPYRSQPLVGRSSRYCGRMWRRYCCLTSFLPIVDTYLSCEDTARQSCAMVPRWRFFDDFLHPVFAANPVQHVSDIVLDGDPALPPQRGTAPTTIFGPFLLWSNGWMHQDATYGGMPQPRELCVRSGPSPSPKRQKYIR